MKITNAQKKSLIRLAAQHDGLNVRPNMRGVARDDRSLAYPVARGMRVTWWRQVAVTIREEGRARAYWTAEVVRVRRPANAVAVLRVFAPE